METNEAYEEAIRRYVCSRCIDCGADGECHSHDPEGCAVFRFLPQMIGLARGVRELGIEPYAKLVRQNICPNCRNQRPDGSCTVRDSLFCALDRYLPLVLEAIEAVRYAEFAKEFASAKREKKDSSGRG